MSFIDFDRKMSVGVPEMDNQHMEIMRLINDLHDAMSLEKGREKIQDILGRLKRYTKFHFVSEEKYMESREFAGLNDHIECHKELTNQIKDIEKRHKTGSAEVTSQMLDFLRGWLLDHIEESDKLYGHSSVSSPYKLSESYRD